MSNADPIYRPWIKQYSAANARLPDADVQTLLEAFEKSAALGPAKTMIRYFDQALSYEAVDRMSDALAVWLQAQGVEPGDRAAVILQNVPQFCIFTLAVWKCGAIILPINPMYGVEELIKLFADARPIAVLCHHDQASDVKATLDRTGLSAAALATSPTDFQALGDPRSLAGHIKRSSELQDLRAVLARYDGQTPIATLSTADDFGLLMYTSGTTGQPKGVVIQHSSLVFAAAITALWGEASRDSLILGIAPMFHITGFVTHLGLAMSAGCSLMLTYRMNPEPVIEIIRQYRPTHVTAAITAYIALMNAPGVGPEDFASFKAAVSGGAPIAPAVRDSLRERIGLEIFPGYGMTETTGPTHYAPFDKGVPVHAPSGALSIGIPVPGTDAIIVDEAGAVVPAGTSGEILLKGPQVMFGYWNKPEETEVNLCDGWMRSGDIGVMDEDGWFYVVDRKKDCIIASGFKVWPREVEDWLYRHPAVREAAVVGAPDGYRGETVKAYVSLRDGHVVQPAELVDHCRTGLAAYKRPHSIEIRPELPKTVSGKIQRNVLRDEARTEGGPRPA
jgi:long-chain acyl-CoA synthetase